SGIQQPNNPFGSQMGALDTFIAAANTALGGNSSVIVGPGQAASYDTANHGSNLGGVLAPAMGTTAAGLGDTMGFYYMTRTGASNTAEAVAAAFNDPTLGAFTWTLKASGDLVFGPTVVPAVPEASTLAMFTAGLLMIGGIARRRHFRNR